MVNGKRGVLRLVFLLVVIHAAGPEDGSIASKVGCVVGVSGGDYEAFARDAVLGEAFGQLGGELGSDAAVVDGHHSDGLLAADDHGARPKFAVDAFMLTIAAAVTGEHHWMFGRHVGFRHAHGAQTHAA